MDRIYRIAFTGSRTPMNEAQYEQLVAAMKRENEFAIKWDVADIEFLHGDCIGSDAIAHVAARQLGWTIRTFPCNLAQFRAHCEADIVEPVDEPLKRNRRMVDLCHVLMATPNSIMETRSGTWSTIHYCERATKRRYVFYPDGSLKFTEKVRASNEPDPPEPERDEATKRTLSTVWGSPVTNEEQARREGLTNRQRGNSDKPFFDMLRESL